MKTAIGAVIGLLLLLACSIQGESTVVQTHNPPPALSLAVLQEPLPTSVTITPTTNSSTNTPRALLDSVTARRPLTYTLTITNYGPSHATGVVVTDTLSAGVSLISATPSQGAGCHAEKESGVPHTIICDLNDLTLGASATITFVVMPITSTGILSHSAIVAANETDPKRLNNRFLAKTQIPPTADLALQLQAPESATAGETLIYSVTVTNNGWAPAAGVVVTDTLPPGVTFAWSVPGRTSQPACARSNDTLICDLGGFTGSSSATITLDLAANASGVSTASGLPAGVTLDLSGPTCSLAQEGHRLICQLGDLDSGTSTDALIAVDIPTSMTGAITHTAIIASQEADPVPQNNTHHAVTSVTATSSPTILTGADLTIHAAVPSRTIAGVPLTHTFLITNHGPLDATDVTLHITQPLENLPAGTSLTSITPGLPNCTPSEGAVTCQLLHLPSGRPVQVTDSVTFTLTISAEASHPIQVALDSALPGWPMCTKRQDGVYCNLGELQSGDDTQVTLVVGVGGQATGAISSTATVRASEPDPNPSDNETITSTQVEIEADLEIRSVASGPAVAGQALTYTLTIINHGLSDATGVILTDSLPPGVTFNSVVSSHGSSCRVVKDFVVTPTGSTQPSHTVMCNFYQIAVTEVASVAIVVTPDPWVFAVTETLTNSAAVSTSQYDPDKDNNEVKLTTPINAEADLSLMNGVESQDTD